MRLSICKCVFFPSFGFYGGMRDSIRLGPDRRISFASFSSAEETALLYLKTKKTLCKNRNQ